MQTNPKEETYHIPVLVEEVLQHLVVKPGGTYIDATFGGGGHSKALLDHDTTTRIIAIDWDKHAHEHAQPLLETYQERLQLVFGSFAHLYKILKKEKIKTVDGILADFGTSFYQIYHEAGFSFARDTPLDMRMSQSHFQKTAADIVNYATLEELCHIFWTYSDERHAKKIAIALIEARKKKKFTTTGQLAGIIETVVPRKGSSIHPATKVFQALRICVNKELDNIQSFLPAAFKALAPGGRLACISFHSLEDRLVKEFFKEQVSLNQAKLITKKAFIASSLEQEENPSSRSAKLRVLERIG